MTYSPQRLLDERAVWQAETGLPAVSLGIQHFSPQGGGYHEGNDLLAAAGRLNTDYSKRQSTRDQPGTDGASAIDIGWFDVNIQRYDGTWRRVTLRDYTVWVIAQLNAGAPDVYFVRELIYSLDGVNVKRWDRLGQSTTGDSSHTSHNHRSDFRDDEGADKSAHVKRFWHEMRGGNQLPTVNDWRVEAILKNRPTVAGGDTTGEVNELHNAISLVLANQASDKTRDEAVAAAIANLAGQISQGGGDIDVAAVINAVNMAASDTKTAVLQKLEEDRERARKAAQTEAIIMDNDPTNDPQV